MSKKFNDLERINGEMAKYFKQKESSQPHAQVYFDVLFEEFSGVINKLIDSGVTHNEVLSFLCEKNKELYEFKDILNELYRNFPKHARKSKEVPN